LFWPNWTRHPAEFPHQGRSLSNLFLEQGFPAPILRRFRPLTARENSHGGVLIEPFNRGARLIG
jgi:hypothetical protein